MKWPEVYEKMGDEFTRDELERELENAGVETEVKQVLYKWKLAGVVEDLRQGRTKSGKMASVKFKKIKVH